MNSRSFGGDGDVPYLVCDSGFMMPKLNNLYILNGSHSLYISYTSIKLIYKETGSLLWVLWTGRGTCISWRRKGKRSRQRESQIHP